jgi:hypothetical protein
MNTSLCASSDSSFELRFIDLAHPGHMYAFPCDAEGHVDIDRLSSQGRANYFFARASVGHHLAWPTVTPRACEAVH